MHNIKLFSILRNSKNTDINSEKKDKKDNKMQKAINKLIDLTERGGVPDYGNFEQITTEFKNQNPKLNADSVKLSITPSILLDERPKEREIQIKVLSKDGGHSYSVALFRGEKPEILAKLNDDSIKKEITEFIELSSEKFNEL